MANSSWSSPQFHCDGSSFLGMFTIPGAGAPGPHGAPLDPIILWINVLYAAFPFVYSIWVIGSLLVLVISLSMHASCRENAAILPAGATTSAAGQASRIREPFFQPGSQSLAAGIALSDSAIRETSGSAATQHANLGSPAPPPLDVFEQDFGYTDALADYLAHAVEFLIFTGCNTALVLICQHTIDSPRPASSCLTRSGLPEGRTTWAMGQVTMSFLWLMARNAKLFLDAKKKAERRLHTHRAEEEEEEDLYGHSPISHDQLFVQLLCLAVFFFPVPYTAIILGDARSYQVLISTVLGSALGIMIHSIMRRRERYGWLHKKLRLLIENAGEKQPRPCVVKLIFSCWGGSFYQCVQKINRAVSKIPGFEFLVLTSEDLPAWDVVLNPDFADQEGEAPSSRTRNSPMIRNLQDFTEQSDAVQDRDVEADDVAVGVATGG